LLAQIKGVLPAAAVEHFRKEFAWLGTVSGPCRDLDVFLLDLGRYEDALGDIHLARLRAFLLARLEVEHEALVAALDCNRYGELLAGWRPFLADGEVEGQPPGQRAELPAEEVFGRRTWKLYKDVARNARSIDAGTPVERLHELRINAKKLRYVLDAGRGLFDGRRRKHAIKTLKSLQDRLGVFNDLCTQIESLYLFGREIEAESGAGTAAVLMDMGRLVEHLSARSRAQRECVGAACEAFASADTRTQFKTLVDSAS
jgi:CHAD domain-containing protein